MAAAHTQGPDELSLRNLKDLPELLAVKPMQDVMVNALIMLLEGTAAQGCVIRIRAIGVLEARQREPKGQWVRNDRLIAVAVHAKVHADLKSVKELNPGLLEEIEAFFHDYNALDGKEFEPLKRAGPSTAATLIEQAQSKKKDSGKKRAA